MTEHRMRPRRHLTSTADDIERVHSVAAVVKPSKWSAA